MILDNKTDRSERRRRSGVSKREGLSVKSIFITFVRLFFAVSLADFVIFGTHDNTPFPSLPSPEGEREAEEREGEGEGEEKEEANMSFEKLHVCGDVCGVCE